MKINTIKNVHYKIRSLKNHYFCPLLQKIGYYTEFSDKNKEIKKACNHGGEEHHDHNHE